MLEGLAKGKRGTLGHRARVEFEPGIPLYAVEFPMPLGVRVLRADYLAPAEVPS